MMMIERAMLKVNRRSSAIGGKGSTIIASTASTPNGTPAPVRSRSRSVGIGVGVEVLVVAMDQCRRTSVPRGIGVEFGVDRRPLRHDRPITPRVLELVDVGENLSNRDVEVGRDLAADLDIAMQGARKRRRLEYRHVALRGDLTVAGRDQ